MTNGITLVVLTVDGSLANRLAAVCGHTGRLGSADNLANSLATMTGWEIGKSSETGIIVLLWLLADLVVSYRGSRNKVPGGRDLCSCAPRS